MRIIGIVLGLFAIVSLAGAVAALSTAPDYDAEVAAYELIVDN